MYDRKTREPLILFGLRTQKKREFQEGKDGQENQGQKNDTEQ